MSHLITLLIGLLIGYSIGREHTPKPTNSKESRKEKILAHLEENEKITNNEVEALLGVGDTTAYKYLQELEEAGTIQQHGETGKYVYYTLKK